MHNGSSCALNSQAVSAGRSVHLDVVDCSRDGARRRDGRSPGVISECSCIQCPCAGVLQNTQLVIFWRFLRQPGAIFTLDGGFWYTTLLKAMVHFTLVPCQQGTPPDLGARNLGGTVSTLWLRVLTLGGLCFVQASQQQSSFSQEKENAKMNIFRRTQGWQW